nr:hypothetical protein [Tanacetum cinerariifolium]
MVNTRNASLTPPITLESLQEQLQQLQQTISTVLTNQFVVNTDIQALKNGRGSQTHNTQYGRMSKIEVELNEAYVVSLFIGGLKKEVSMPIRMFKITNLIDVYAMAKMQEATNAVLKPRYNSSLLPTPKFVSNSVNKHVIAPFKSINVNGVNQNVSKIGGNRPYRLTRKQLYSLEVVGENNNELVAEAEGEIFEDYVDEVLTIDSTPQISLNALCGLNSFQTMRVKGMFRKHTLHILWSLQKETFTSDVMFLPLEGCEMVLGIQ